MRRLNSVHRGITNISHCSFTWISSTKPPTPFPGIDPFWVQNHTLNYSSAELQELQHSKCVEELCGIVSNEIGSLDDLETTLNKSQGFIINSTLVADVINCCKSHSSTRRLLRFMLWSCKTLNHEDMDDAFNHAIMVFAERKDFIALDILISDLQKEHGKMNVETFRVVAEAFVKLGKEDKALGLFKNLDKLRCARDGVSVCAIVSALCSKGHARKAEGVVWHHKNEILGLESVIYRNLVHGWFVNGNVKEIRRVIEEMKSNRVHVDLFCYNTFLRCICKRNLKFNPSSLVQDALNLIVEMKSNGIIPSVVSFNILLSCLCKARRVKEAYGVLFQSMKKLGCSPDWFSYYLVVRVMYLTGRFGIGNRIVDEMTEEGVVAEPTFYRDLVSVLCGVERVNHALNLFEKMKKVCVGNYGPVYDLLIPKLCRGGDFEKGKQLWDEATSRGVVLQCSESVLDPSITEVFEPAKNVEGSIKRKE
ncbi:hypothetical protein Scep_002322 [Stephania cephalantha]|uniref:Pentatricopeptide repeat-containing protein n=1 Tax=Stephania cephalantha TaxID=152367 RepID=A0AAP0LA12_9MAGN